MFNNRSLAKDNHPEDMVPCPYDAVHVLQRKKLISHVEKCSKNFPDNPLVKCRFNVYHRVPRSMLADHLRVCEDARVAEESRKRQQENPVDDSLDGFSTFDSGFSAGFSSGFDSHQQAPGAYRSGSAHAGLVDGFGRPCDTLQDPAEQNRWTDAPSAAPAAAPGHGRGRGRGRGAPHLSNPAQRRPGAAPMNVAAAPPPGFAQPYSDVAASSQASQASLIPQDFTDRDLPDFLRPKRAEVEQACQLTNGTANGLYSSATPSVQQDGSTHGDQAPVPQPEPVSELEADEERRREQLQEFNRAKRRYGKLLNQISALEAKRNNGDELDEDQLAKIARKDMVLRELDNISRLMEACGTT